MSHRVKVTKLPKLRQDGTIVPGKYKYTVVCKSRHGTCFREEFTSSVLADATKNEHHREMSRAHYRRNPNDNAHHRSAERKSNLWQ